MPFYVPISYPYYLSSISLSIGLPNIHSSVPSSYPSMNTTRNPPIFTSSVVYVEHSSGSSYFPSYYPSIPNKPSSCTLFSTQDHPQLLNMEIILMLLKPYWIHCAVIMISGRRVDTVNLVGMLVEIFMEDNFAVRNQNILALNPRAFQVWLYRKFQVVFQVHSCIVIPLLSPQAFPMNYFKEIHPKTQATVLQYFHLLLHMLNLQIIPFLSPHILRVFQSSQSHTQAIPTWDHLK